MVAYRSQRLVGRICSFLKASWWLQSSSGGPADIPKICTARAPSKSLPEYRLGVRTGRLPIAIHDTHCAGNTPAHGSHPILYTVVQRTGLGS